MRARLINPDASAKMIAMRRRASWPKVRAALTPEQEQIMADWQDNYLSSVLPQNFGWVDRFGHEFAAQSAKPRSATLEIGAGNGSHLSFESGMNREYVALELSDRLAGQILDRNAVAKVVLGNCQERIPFPDQYFDRVLAIHVLEHLENLPAALDEIVRVMKPMAIFSAVIPCERGAGYALGRAFTTKRVFEKRYKTDYKWMIRYDHVNTAREVLSELTTRFRVERRRFFPLRVHSIDLNLVIGLEVTLDQSR